MRAETISVHDGVCVADTLVHVSVVLARAIQTIVFQYYFTITLQRKHHTSYYFNVDFLQIVNLNQFIF